MIFLGISAIICFHILCMFSYSFVSLNLLKTKVTLFGVKLSIGRHIQVHSHRSQGREYPHTP